MSKKIIVQGRPFTTPPSGYQTFAKNFFSHLAKRLTDYTFEILTPSEVSQEQFELPSNVAFKVIPSPQTSPEFFSTLLWENVYVSDYVKSQDSSQLSFYLSPYNSLPIFKFDVPEFMVLHDIDLWIDRGVRWEPERRLGYEVRRKSIYNADIIFTVSDFSHNQISDFFTDFKKPIVTIYEDINPFYKSGMFSSRILERYKLEAKKYFLYIGSNEPRKNLSKLIEAYGIYAQRSNPTPLILCISSNARTGNLNPFNNLNNPHIICIPEQLENQDIGTLASNALAYVYPSNYEGFGLQILEAQNCGCPVIASDIPTFHEVGGEGVLYMNQEDSQSIADSMSELETNPNLRADLTLKGRENAEKFSWDKTIEIFIKSVEKHL